LTYYPENVFEDNRWIVESWPKALEEAYYKDPKVIATEIEAARKPRTEPETFRASGPEPTVAHFARFFEAMRTRKPGWEDATAGHRAAACAHLINLSAKRRNPVEWDFSKDDLKG
jgi:hypothetical protein